MVSIKMLSSLISDIRHGKVQTNYDIANRTTKLLEQLITEDWENEVVLRKSISDQMKITMRSLPETEVTCANIMRHFLKIIRHETGSKCNVEEQSLHQMVTSTNDSKYQISNVQEARILRTTLLDHLIEYREEFESSTEFIAAQASEHIHSNEYILTLGRSNTVLEFLKHANKTRKFTVIVVEGSPSYQGHTMAVKLAKANIQTVVISDSAIFAIMSRVNKVIIGTYAILADGGLQAASGSNMVALAAKHFSVPVIVLAHLCKLTPKHASSPQIDAFNSLTTPSQVLPNKNGPLINDVSIVNPLFDRVRPENVTLIISHQGGNAPSYIYQLLSELYHSDDYDL